MLNSFMTRLSLSYRNQSIDLFCKSVDWFLYERKLHHERVNRVLIAPQSYRNIIGVLYKNYFENLISSKEKTHE